MWSNDYITQLQLRSKWRHVQENLAVGDLVLVKEDNTAPLHWPLGRITKVFPGRDNLVRVVEVLMKGRIYKRPDVKLAPLPRETHQLEEDIDTAMALEKNVADNLDGCKKTQAGADVVPQEEIRQKKDKNVSFCAIAIWDDICAKESAQLRQYEKSASARRRVKVWSVSSVVAAIFLCLFCFCYPVSAQSYMIRHFAPQTVAYVEKCRDINEITGYWNVAVHINLDAYYGDIDQLHEPLRSLEQRCKQREKNSICEQVITNYGKKLRAIKEHEKAIKNKMTSRNKRGVGLALLGTFIGVAGTLAYNWVAGAFASSHQYALLEKQTSVIESASQRIITLENTIHNVTMFQNEEIWATAWLASAFDNVSKNQNKILKIITKEEFDMEEIPIEVWMNQVKIISNHTKKTSLYGENTLDQALNMYKLARVSKIITVKNSVVTFIRIPLISDTSFGCSRIIPIPFSRSSITEMISIEGEYVLINEHRNQFCKKKGFERCLQLNENIFCELEKTMEKTMEKTNDSCELDIVLNKQKHSCATVEYGAGEFLEKIQPHTWLFGTSNSTALIKCENGTHTVKLNGTGILKLEQKCSAKIKNVNIRGLDNAVNNIVLSTENWRSISLGVAGTVQAPSNKLEKELEELKDETKLHRFFHMHHTTILYVFVIWIVFCIILMLIRQRKNKKTNPK